MVCIYCGSSTWVKNSRSSAKYNTTWRRRTCQKCQGVFTTIEYPELASSFVVKDSRGQLTPFNRDRLFIDVYESCKHRPSALDDAAGLAKTVAAQLGKTGNGVILSSDIIATTTKVLKRFDRSAAVVYTAYHSR